MPKQLLISRWIYLFFGLIGTTLLVAQEPFVCQNNFYFSFGSSSGASQLHEVIIEPNGDVNFLPLPNTTGVSLNAVGYRSTDNLIYGVGTVDERLYQIDATGRSFPLAILDVNHNNGFYAATITPNGDEMIIVEQPNTFNGGSVALVVVDLTDENYPIKRSVPLNGPTVQTTDIAFDPITGILYGFNSRESNLIIIDPDSGLVTANFPPSTVADRMGGLYFDAFGKMFGYGNATNDINARNFFGIDKNTGLVTNLGTGPNTSSKDGCACPFTIDLLKDVTPRQVVPCTELTYNFEISNLSGETITGLDLTDTMPEDFVILRLDKNPYGGTFTGAGTNILRIEDMTVPLGQDSIKVVVEALPFAQGVYKNQSYLDDLPVRLGSRSPSDDPTTVLSDDSTSIEVFPLVINLANQQQNLCEGASIELVAGTIDGIDYEWNTGSSSPTLTVTEPGQYAVTITNGCEVEIDSVFISEEPISVSLGEAVTINLGDYHIFNPKTSAIGTLRYDWTEKDSLVDCSNCSTLEVRPFFDTDYEVQITSPSGCMATANVAVFVTKDRGIYIPNVFSPNFDGINDQFYILGKGFAEILVFQVYDRWGNLVFSRNNGAINDATIGWDGTFDSQNAATGVYRFYTKIVYLDGVEESFVGYVSLVR